MAITITTAARNAAINAVVDLLDVGSTDSNGDLVIMTAGDVEVATLALSDPAFGAGATGVATAAAISNDASATGGTAALFKMQDKDNTEVFRGTVGTSGADLNISTLTIPAASIVSVSSFTLTMPATSA